MIVEPTPVPVLNSHTSTVSWLTSNELFVSGTETADAVPLNASAVPYLPVVHEGDVIEPVLFEPETSFATAPEPSSNAYAATGPAGVVLPTVTVMLVDVVVLPAASRATAVT